MCHTKVKLHVFVYCQQTDTFCNSFLNTTAFTIPTRMRFRVQPTRFMPLCVQLNQDDHSADTVKVPVGLQHSCAHNEINSEPLRFTENRWENRTAFFEVCSMIPVLLHPATDIKLWQQFSQQFPDLYIVPSSSLSTFCRLLKNFLFRVSFSDLIL